MIFYLKAFGSIYLWSNLHVVSHRAPNIITSNMLYVMTYWFLCFLFGDE